jgi:hypothetical protein
MKTLKMIRKICGLQTVLFSLVISTSVQAQTKDTLAPLREFVSVSNGYKQMPMYIGMEMQSSTNFITNETDTTTVQGEFFLKQENSYVRFGEFEQVVNDSLALLVSNKLSHMVLFRDAGPVVLMMQKMMGVNIPDSNLLKMAERYSGGYRVGQKNETVIELQSRAKVYTTSHSKETIEMRFDTKSRKPLQVVTVSRNLIRLDSLQYQQLQAELTLTANLLLIEGAPFLLKEQVTTWVYKKMEYPFTGNVPVLITDRVGKDAEGEYKPVKNYEMYRLTIN